MVGVSMWMFRARVRAQMNATPPEARTEYSRGSELFSGAPERSGGGPVARLILAVGALGGLLLVVAEFTTLFEVRTPGSTAVVRSVGTGSHHTYAMLPIALLAVFLAYGVWRVHSRPALWGIALLSVVALLITLLGDLPDATSTGLLRDSTGHFVIVGSQPSIGFYLESLGGVALLITAVGGFLLAGAPASSSRSRASRRPSVPPTDDRHRVGTNQS